MLFINFKEALDGQVANIEIEGPLDSQTSPSFEDYVNQFLEKKIFFILLDLKNLSYVSSEGIGSLLYLQQKLSAQNGFLVLYNLATEIKALFQVLGFDKVFRISKTRSESLEIMDRQIELRDSFSKIHPNSQDQSQSDFDPFIIKCVNCNSYLRIKAHGDFLCPDCQSPFTVRENQMVLF